MLDKRIRVLRNTDLEFNNHTLMPFLGMRVQVAITSGKSFGRQMYLVALKTGKIVLNDELTDVSTLNEVCLPFNIIKYFSFGAEVAISDNGTIYKV